MSFPQDFVWGAASASYQVEGAAYEDGKGLSVWDVFSRRDGKIYNGDTGDVGCNHYHLYQEDVALMQRIGLHAYRFSISWPRVLPGGTGSINDAGLDFYDRLVDALLVANITPYPTLFHWDFPHALYCQGGWLNRDVADWFAEYTGVVTQRLGDRVKHWMTINEPSVFLLAGHLMGRHAPGDQVGLPELLRVLHHVFLAHGKAVQSIRANVSGAQVGLAAAGDVAMPASDDPADIEAARQVMFSPARSFSHTWWSDAPVLGRYPDASGTQYAGLEPPQEPGDMDIIQQPLDFFGANIYQGEYVRAGADGPETLPSPMGARLTHTNWRVTPEALYWGPRFLHERYNLPVIVTENGVSLSDWVSLDGKVHDPLRIDFMQRYLRELRRASADGVPVRGYFHWSVMDNFEWSEGMKERFGLIHIDYATHARTLKDSALWYHDVIASNGANL